MNKLFFNTLQQLEHWIGSFTFQQTSCRHCHRHGHLHSHGFVRKAISSTETVVIGKRIYCCNRRLKNGCGLTSQLYLIDFTPFIHFSISCLELFLIRKKTCPKPHKNPSSRTLCRWKNKFKYRLFTLRTFAVDQLGLTIIENMQMNNNSINSFASSTVNILSLLKSPFLLYQLTNQKPIF